MIENIQQTVTEPTYRQIQHYIWTHHGCMVKNCWIAHVKELNGLHTRRAYNRPSLEPRRALCPPDKQLLIEEALRHFGVIK